MIPDPHAPSPQDTQDAIDLLHFGSTEYIKPAVDWLEANDTAHANTLKRAHRLLTEAGYLLEEMLNVAPGYFAAGGSNKGPW